MRFRVSSSPARPRAVALAAIAVVVGVSVGAVAPAFPVVLFEDDFEADKDWELMEEVPTVCYLPGLGDVRRESGTGVGGSTALLVHANKDSTLFANKVFGAKHVGVGESHVARLTYELSAQIDRETADDTQTGPEFSVQVTHDFGDGADDHRTLIVGFQYVPTPHADPDWRWNIWTERELAPGTADWETIKYVHLTPGEWYRFELTVDLIEARYERLVVTGPGVSENIPLFDEPVAREVKFFEEATWISVDATNLWTWCGVFGQHDAKVRYDDVRLTQLGERLE